jgi:hypothetical protein
VDVEIVVDDDPFGDELRNLRGWLLDEVELRGRVSLRERPTGQDTLTGGIPEAVVVAVAAAGVGGTAALVRTLGNVLVAWLKTRRGQVDITVTGSDGAKVDLKTKDVRGLDADGVRDLLDELTRMLTPPPGRDGSADGRSAGVTAVDAARANGAADVESDGGRARAGRRTAPS